MKDTRRNEKGISTAAAVLVVVIAIAVVAAGVYVVMGKDSKESGETVIQGDLGIGSKFYYPVEAAVADPAPTAIYVPIKAPLEIVSEVIGENGSYYFFSIVNPSSGDVYSVKMHKSTGDIDEATLTSEGYWKITITTESNEVIIDIKTEGYSGLGNLMSEIKITTGSTAIYATLNVNKNVILAPSEYKTSEFLDKFCDYDMDMSIVIPLVMDLTAHSDMKMTVVGNAANGMYLFLMEMDMTTTVAGVTSSLSMKQMFASEYAFDFSDDMIVLGEKTTIEFKGKTVNVQSIEYDFGYGDVAFDMVGYVGIDKPILYSAESTIDIPGALAEVTIKCVDTNF